MATRSSRSALGTGAAVTPSQAAFGPPAGLPDSAPDLLATLGLVGLSELEPVVLAALATQQPLLLIGPHGSGKSLLLERLAQALNLSWRHYNAALVNFDDLVGYPLPDEKGQLRFVQTPASIWGAQAVFVDEISRARLDVQNRLFPIIHERRVQGMPLSDLQHRWAAMNPPALDDDEAMYAGIQALDLALADRFALQARVPDWRTFSPEQQEAVIHAAQCASHPNAPQAWANAIERTRTALPMVQAQWAGSIARYVRILASLLAQAGAEMSARRAGMLASNLAAVHAARLARDPQARMDDSAWLATLNSMPFAASGRKLEGARLLTCHREAWRQADARADAPLGRILAERDPVVRVQLALSATGLPDGELTTIVTDALSGAADGARYALAQWLFECGAVARLSVVAADTAAEVYRDVACVQEVLEHVAPNGSRHRVWKRIKHHLGAMPDDQSAETRGNLLAALFAARRLTREDDVDAVIASYEQTCLKLGLPSVSMAPAGEAA